MNTTSEWQHAFQHEGGVLKSIDFSRIYAASQQQGRSASEPDIRLPKLKEAERLSGFFRQLFQQADGTGTALILRSALTLPPVPHPRKIVAPVMLRMPHLKTKAYTAYRSRAGGSKSEQVNLTLPFGMPRFVRATTLREMLGGRSWDVLFRKVGTRWTPCPDEFQVDLKDSTQVFKLGEVQILS